MTTTYQAPGVYVNEITPAPLPGQGASTSIAAFVGAVELSVAGISFAPPVQAFSNFAQFKRAFQAATATPDKPKTKLPDDKDTGFTYLANAVYGFFANGGARCFVTVVDAVAPPAAPPPVAPMAAMQTAMLAVATGDPYDMSTDNATALLGTIKASALGAPFTVEQLRDAKKSDLAALLTTDVTSAVAKSAGVPSDDAGQANLVSDLVSAAIDAAKGAANPASAAPVATPLSAADLKGALKLLEPFDEISIVAAPGLTSTTQWSDLCTHCEEAALNRFGVLDCPADASWAANAPTSQDMPTGSDSAAIYFPWIAITDAITGKTKYAPPSGHVAGMYARVDASRGVFKAPANESLSGVTGLQHHTSTNQQKELNLSTSDVNSVNCIRRLNGSILVWGARTFQANDTPYKYVSTRRTFNYIRASLEKDTQWAVFEPNNQALWGKITRNVTSFLKGLWQQGGLVGATQADAFYVKCDEETNPPDVRNAGQVVAEVGVAITTPAEFVVFNLGVMTGPSASS